MNILSLYFEAVLATLEQGEQSGAIARLAGDRSPKQALELIYRLKGLLSGSGKT